MKISRKYLVSISLILAMACIVSVSNTVSAQDASLSLNNLELSSSPASPAPGEPIVITAKSYLIDLNSSNITWMINGTKTSSGIGQTTLNAKAPALGKSLNITASASSETGAVTGNISIKSGGINFIIESSGYVPPFFLGKLSPAYQNSVRIIAIPHIADSSGVEYAPTNLIYKWTKDSGIVLAEQSGYGKQTVTMEGNIIPRPYSLKLEVTNRDGSNMVSRNVTIIPEQTKIAFYKNDSLYGPLYNYAIGNSVSMGTAKELSVVAVPYGFDKILNSIGDLKLNWTINSTEKPELSGSNIVILRSKDGESGASSVELSIENTQNILQSSGGGFSVVFNNKADAATSTKVTF